MVGGGPDKSSPGTSKVSFKPGLGTGAMSGFGGKVGRTGTMIALGLGAIAGAAVTTVTSDLEVTTGEMKGTTVSGLGAMGG